MYCLKLSVHCLVVGRRKLIIIGIENGNIQSVSVQFRIFAQFGEIGFPQQPINFFPHLTDRKSLLPPITKTHGFLYYMAV